ncbi:signal peptidase I [Halorubrum cibi]|uniref:Signal peptidase, endoplasmic reticulum-type n=1 Tax=Halorubrum cibi TaxID=413815 RepID=A0A521EEM4_9EURY|nr:signal peptidase I [Halorubrum cibi]SMO82377.1 signal peptidase, endoplasmic reticulum-type [Halorubrum cibi]
MNSPITFKRFANLLGIALLIAVVAPFVVYAVPAVVGAEYSFVVLTASMTPAIAPGDVVVVDERDAAAIGEGDVITFVRGESEVPVTHRVIGVTGTGGEVAFETKGDANEGPDSALVPASNVLGAVAFSIPYIGYVIQFTDSPAGFTLLVVLPFALLALSEVWSLYGSRTGRGGDSTAAGSAVVDADADAEAMDTQTTATTAAAATESAQSESDAADEPGFVVTNRTVEGAVGVLLAFVPYAAYTAYTLQTALSIAVAVGTGMTLLMAGVLLVTSGDGEGPSNDLSRSADDGGDDTGDGSSGDGGDGGDGRADGDDGDRDADRDAPAEGDDAGSDADGDDLEDFDDHENDRPGGSRGTDDGNPMGIFERPLIAPAADGGSEAVVEAGEPDEIAEAAEADDEEGR